jgi:DNA-binding transcriptional LysR family regulator
MQELGMGHLRIGVSNTLCKYILLPYLKDFVKQYPHIKITIECQSTYKTLELLNQNKIDIGLIGKPDNLKGMDFYEIQQIEDIFVSTQTYLDNLSLQLSKDTRNKVPPKAQNATEILRYSNVMLLDEKNITRLYVEDYFTRNNIKTNQLLEVSSMDLLIDFAKIGLGISCVIKEFIQEELKTGELLELPLDPPLEKRSVGFAHSKEAFLPQAVKHFINFYKERCISQVHILK